MKIKGLFVTGLLLSILGVGLTAIASTQLNIREELNAIFQDPSLEEKQESFGSIKSLKYEGNAENLTIQFSEEENKFIYYEGTYIYYDISYDAETEELKIQQHNRSIFGGSFATKASVLYIASPLEICSLSISAGDLNVNDLSISHADITLNAGNMKFQNMQIGLASLEVNAGNVDLKNCEFQTLTAELNAGNVTFLGDIYAYADIEVNAGNFTLKLKRGSESYKINGRGTGETIINTDVSVGNKVITFNN